MSVLNRFLKWLRGSTKPVPIPTVSVVHRDIMRVTIADWRSNPDMVTRARSALSNPDVRMMLDVLRLQHNLWLPDLSASANVRLALQNRNEGYTLALNDFEDLAKYQEPAGEVPITFKPENADEQFGELQ